MVDMVTERSSSMELKIVNPDPRYSRSALIEPASLGYINVAAEVSPLRYRHRACPTGPAVLAFAEREGRWVSAGWHASPVAGAPSFLSR